ncbi:MAG TPA: DEAD/DEAH box helicase [Pseudonocardiaceae bacterium]|nr:DEAD/DEAH box helicase [Pseudonocardiaceae bacterium]
MSVDATGFLAALGTARTASQAGQAALLRRVTGVNDQGDADERDVARAAILLEEESVRAYLASRQEVAELFGSAVECLRLLGSSPESREAVAAVEPPLLPLGLDLPFRFAVCGLLARDTAEIRLVLGDLVVVDGLVRAAWADDEPGPQDWAEQLLTEVFGAFILLVRKQGGWSDLDTALALLAGLKQRQRDLEPDYLSRATEAGAARTGAIRLVALFHLAQAVTEAGQYLVDGGAGQVDTLAVLDRHHDQARAALEALAEPGTGTLIRFADLLWAGCRELVANSLWTHVAGLGPRIGEFARALTDRGRPNPVLELWPSQQQALAGNIFDEHRRAVLVELPTSAGKTLLAEFLMVQSRALRPTGTIAYLVPTRALVNQVTRDVRADLRPLGMTVEQAVPAYELDPAEQALLADPPDILVTTPEKLSLLLRRGHPCLTELALVVVDEAHNLADEQRGARLELLLATIRRDKPTTRYLLLSPFIPAAAQLVDWLGGDAGLPPITVNWRPSSRIVATVSVAGQRPDRELVLTTLEAAGNADVPGGRRTVLAPVANASLPGRTTVKAVSGLAARRFRQRGSTLILCWGAGTAMARAAEIAADAEPMPPDPFRDAVTRYLRAEYGADMPLAGHIATGVAYHHRGMAQDTRVLIEALLRDNLVHTVCGTTTLAQGVNFPISNVIVETSRKGRDGRLSYADLWNVIGRAGRTLRDDVGLVGFPVARVEQAQQWQEFMRGEATAIASQLSRIIDRAADIGEVIGLHDVRTVPGLTDLLQFLSHAMRVGGATRTAAELEELLGNSLGFAQAQTSSAERGAALVALCRRYLAQVSTEPSAERVALSDQTGFSTPTIDLLLASAEPSLADEATWQPATLFDADNTALALRMRILGEVPELRSTAAQAESLSAERVAAIVRDWVLGVSIGDLSARHWPAEGASAARVTGFAKYLFGQICNQASWGLGALQNTYLAPSGSAPSAARYVPSMVYFGVSTPAAVWLSMVGVPRIVAVGVGEQWLRVHDRAPNSFAELRDWLATLAADDWAAALRRNGSESPSAPSGADLRRIWQQAIG